MLTGSSWLIEALRRNLYGADDHSERIRRSFSFVLV